MSKDISHRSELIAALRRQRIIDDNKAIATALADHVQLKSVVPGEFLITQGGSDHDLFFILSGTVAIVLDKHEIATRRQGEHVGEMALIDVSARRSASVVAAEPTIAAAISEPDFSAVANRYPQIWRSIAIELSDRLQASNRANREIAEHLELRVRARTDEVEAQSIRLREVNTALRVLLKDRQNEKIEQEEKILSNVHELIEPYFEKIEKTPLSDRQRTIISIIESNLRNIVSAFPKNLKSRTLNLTPGEIRIASLIRQGRSTKSIAAVLDISPRTVDTHRRNIRKKLGINSIRANLRTHLMNLSE